MRSSHHQLEQANRILLACALVMLAGSVAFGYFAAKVFSWEAVIFVFCALYAVMSVVMSALMFLLATTVQDETTK